MSGDHQSPPGWKAGEDVRRFQAGNDFKPDLPRCVPASHGKMPVADINVVSLAMRQFYQSPSNATG